jgi:DNA-binding transcriptional MocR family regulator
MLDWSGVNTYIVMVTMWQPQVGTGKGPTYRQVVEALANDIRSGRLRAGERLPPQRDLASSIGVTVGTITRAYQLAARQGLVGGEIGRGTYVRPLPGQDDGVPLDLSLNAMPAHAHVAELAERLEIGADANRAVLLDYPPRVGRDEHRAAGAEWIARRDVDVPPSQVVVTIGAQHALAIAIAAITQSSTPLLVEELTYAGIVAAACLFGIPIVPVSIDVDGMRPDALRDAARASGARAVAIQPSLHNPTGVSMSANRRAEILDVIRQERLAVIEDDTYGFLVPESRPIVAEVDGAWCYVTGLSKSLAAGFRTGFLATSPSVFDRAAAAMFATAVAASPIAVQLAVSLIADGTADRIVEWKRDETRARLMMARQILPDIPGATHEASPHLWLPLARPWRAAAFVAAARSRGIVLGPTESFLGRPGAVPRAVRISLAPPRTRQRLQSALESIAEIASAVPLPAATV